MNDMRCQNCKSPAILGRKYCRKCQDRRNANSRARYAVLGRCCANDPSPEQKAAKTRAWYAANGDKARRRARNVSRDNVVQMSERYIALLLRSEGVQTDAITVDLVLAKRTQLMSTRKIREVKNVIKQANKQSI